MLLERCTLLIEQVYSTNWQCCVINKLISFGCLGCMRDQRQLSWQIIWGKCPEQLLSVLLFANKLVGCSYQVNRVTPVPVDLKYHEMVQLCVCRYVFTRFEAENDHSLAAFVAGITNNNLPSVQISDRSNLWESSTDWKNNIRSSIL